MTFGTLPVKQALTQAQQDEGLPRHLGRDWVESAAVNISPEQGRRIALERARRAAVDFACGIEVSSHSCLRRAETEGQLGAIASALLSSNSIGSGVALVPPPQSLTLHPASQHVVRAVDHLQIPALGRPLCLGRPRLLVRQHVVPAAGLGHLSLPGVGGDGQNILPFVTPRTLQTNRPDRRVTVGALVRI